MSSLNGFYQKLKTAPAPGIRADTICTETWTKEREAHLTRRWADGMSASQIASELGGTSRNAVIGKAHRMGLADRVARQRKHFPGGGARKLKKPRPPRAWGRPKPNSNIGVIFDASPLPPPLESDIPRMTFAQLDDAFKVCRWPVDVPNSPPMYCGDAVVPGAPHPYCYAHMRRAAPTPIPRRPDTNQLETTTPNETLIDA